MKRSRKRSKGFSLLEMIAVITILGIITAIVFGRITQTTRKAKIKICHEFKAEINSAVERYWFKNGSLPNDLDDLEDPDDFPDGVPRNCPLANDPYTLNPVSKRVVGHNH